MFIGGNVWNNPREVAWFYEGYKAVEVDMALLTYYRCERIVEDIAVYYQELLDTSKATENRDL